MHKVSHIFSETGEKCLLGDNLITRKRLVAGKLQQSLLDQVLATDKALFKTFKGFLPTDCTNVAFSFTFTDHINSFITDRYFVQHKNIKISKNQTHFKDEELNFLIQNNEPFKKNTDQNLFNREKCA